MGRTKGDKDSKQRKRKKFFNGYAVGDKDPLILKERYNKHCDGCFRHLAPSRFTLCATCRGKISKDEDFVNPFFILDKMNRELVMGGD